MHSINMSRDFCLANWKGVNIQKSDKFFKTNQVRNQCTLLTAVG